MAEYLKFGALGIGAILLAYATILLRQELAKAQPQPEIKEVDLELYGVRFCDGRTPPAWGKMDGNEIAGHNSGGRHPCHHGFNRHAP